MSSPRTRFVFVFWKSPPLPAQCTVDPHEVKGIAFHPGDQKALETACDVSEGFLFALCTCSPTHQIADGFKLEVPRRPRVVVANCPAFISLRVIRFMKMPWCMHKDHTIHVKFCPLLSQLRNKNGAPRRVGIHATRTATGFCERRSLP